MEKYCTSCGSVFKDTKVKFCSNCGSKLKTREGRQPIPRKLRHKVFERDGYRCRECGASVDDGATLEIDHIVPVAKGGKNDIDNLQTLCKKCNRMKLTDTWVGGESNIDAMNNRLEIIQEEIIETRYNLNQSENEEDIINYKFKLKRLNEELNTTKAQIIELKNVQKENQWKDFLFKKLYVEIDDGEIISLSKFTSSECVTKEQILRYIVDNYNKEDIDKFISGDYEDVVTNCRFVTPAQIRVMYSDINQQFIEEGKIAGVEEIMDRANVRYRIIEKNRLYGITLKADEDIFIPDVPQSNQQHEFKNNTANKQKKKKGFLKNLFGL